MSEHIRFVTVGFADLINNLPDPDAVIGCSECGHLHFDTTAGDYIACPLVDEGCPCPLRPDDTAVASDPELADYWPDDYEPAVCDACGRDDHTPAELADCIDSALGLPDDYDYRADYDGPLTDD